LVLGGEALADEQAREGDERVAAGVLLALHRRTVERLVVGEGMRVRADHVRVHQRGTAAGAAPRGRLPQLGQARERIGAVDLAHQQVGEGADEARDAAPRRLHLHRHRDGVTVVLDEVEHRGFADAGRVEALPELAFRGGALAGGAIRYLVVRSLGSESLARYLSWGALRAPQTPDCRIEGELRLRAAHRVEELRAGGGALGDDAPGGAPP